MNLAFSSDQLQLQWISKYIRARMRKSGSSNQIGHPHVGLERRGARVYGGAVLFVNSRRIRACVRERGRRRLKVKSRLMERIAKEACMWDGM